MPAVITTQPLTFDGTSVGITADVSDGGSVRVAILDKARNQLASSEPIHLTVTDSRVKWEPSQDLANLRGKEIRLRFQLHNAKLYAFQIGQRVGNSCFIDVAYRFYNVPACAEFLERI